MCNVSPGPFIDGSFSNPGLVNRDPYGDGWMVKVQLRSPNELSGLMTSEDYAMHIGE